MTVRPITPRPPMLQALLGGRKTQDRTVLKPQPDRERNWTSVGCPEFRTAIFRDAHGWRQDVPLPCAPGDLLWVRENCATWEGKRRDAVYCADLTDDEWRDIAHDICNGAPWKRRPSIHMPRWASRLTLRVTDVRVQRVQDISEADTEAEGVDRWGLATWKNYTSDGTTHVVLNCRHSFSTLWNSIHGPDAWSRNDWVEARTFDVIRANVDQVQP